MQYKKFKLSFEILIILLVTAHFVSAFGVTTYYWDDKPLVLYPGQTKDVDVVLQNMVGGSDIRLKAEITSGSEIATLIDPSTEYLVPFGRKDIKVNIRVSVPKNIPLENKYNIGVSFKQIVEEEGRMVQMASAVGTSIPVVIKSLSEIPVEEEKKVEVKKESRIPSTLFLLILVIVILIIGYFALRKKK